MPSVRVDLIVVFAAALLTIFVVKLTSLLPASLYFNFSSTFSDDLGAFLVPRPALEAQAQCELAQARGFSFKPCPGTYGSREPMDAAEREKVVQAVIESQVTFLEGPSLFSGYREQENGTVERIASALEWRDDLTDFRDTRPGVIADNLFRPMLEDVHFRIDPDGGYEDGLIYTEGAGTDEEVRTATATRLAEAERRALDDMVAGGGFPALKLGPQQVAEITQQNPVRDEAVSAVGNVLRERFSAAFLPLYTARLVEAGVNVDAIASEFRSSVVAQTGWQYAFALLIRLMVPVVAGVLLALLLGAQSRISIATGGAFAAFLLAWPVALLWDGIVAPRYLDLRLLFLCFYFAYVLSFFTLAWLGATLGAMAGLALQLRTLRAADEMPQLAGVGRLAKEVPFQLFLNVVTNGITLALSFIVFGGDVGYV
jgi:hypothetical protein